MKLVVIQTAFLGDFILTTPVLKKLSEHFGRENVIVVARPHISQISKNKVISFDKSSGRKFKELIKVIIQVRKIKPQIAVVPHLSATSALIPIFAGVKNVVGFEENSLSFLFSKKIRKYISGVVSESERIARVLIPLGIEPIQLEPEIRLDLENLNYWKSVIGETEKRKIVFAPFSNWGTKTWPWWNKFLSIYSGIYSAGIKDRIIVLGEKEVDIPSPKNQSILNLTGRTTLKDTVSIIYLSDLFLGVDNGLSHIASALKKRCLIVFGPTTPKFGFFPNFSDFTALELAGLPCKPCSPHGPQSCPLKHFKCMMNLSPDIVLKFLKDFR